MIQYEIIIGGVFMKLEDYERVESSNIDFKEGVEYKKT